MWLWVWPVLGLALATTSTSAGGEPEPSSVDKVSCGGRDTEVHSPLFVKTVHDEAHFRCEGGFQLRGQRIATCVANNWDHPFPTCQELNKTTIKIKCPYDHRDWSLENLDLIVNWIALNEDNVLILDRKYIQETPSSQRLASAMLERMYDPFFRFFGKLATDEKAALSREEVLKRFKQSSEFRRLARKMREEDRNSNAIALGRDDDEDVLVRYYGTHYVDVLNDRVLPYGDHLVELANVLPPRPKVDETSPASKSSRQPKPDFRGDHHFQPQNSSLEELLQQQEQQQNSTESATETLEDLVLNDVLQATLLEDEHDDDDELAPEVGEQPQRQAPAVGEDTSAESGDALRSSRKARARGDTERILPHREREFDYFGRRLVQPLQGEKAAAQDRSLRTSYLSHLLHVIEHILRYNIAKSDWPQFLVGYDVSELSSLASEIQQLLQDQGYHVPPEMPPRRPPAPPPAQLCPSPWDMGFSMVANGRVFIEEPGYRLSVECDSGYTLRGPKYFHCENGQWRTNERYMPMCVSNSVIDVQPTPPGPAPPPAASQCGPPRPGLVRNGDLVSLPASGGSHVRVVCHPGYAIRGSDELVCDRGRWMPASPGGGMPMCVDERRMVEVCLSRLPPSPQHGSVTPSHVLSDGRTVVVRYMCNPGFGMQGADYAKCEDGLWVPLPPVCVEGSRDEVPHLDEMPQRPARCPMLAVPYGRVFFYEDGASYARVVCAPGYLLAGAPKVMCDATAGAWVEPVPRCVDQSGGAGSPVDGTDSGGGGGERDPSGGEGDPRGGATTPRRPTSDCPDMQAPLNGAVTYVTQTAVRFTCDDGFRLEGAQQSTCYRGRWMEPPPRCVRTTTAVPSIGGGGDGSCNLDEPARQPNAVVYAYLNGRWFECMPGYELVGAMIQTCLGNGRWSEEPRCVAPPGSPALTSAESRLYPSPQCPLPSSSDPSLLVTPRGHKVYYRCRERTSQLVGAMSNECVNGRWMHQLPRCLRRAPPPPPPTPVVPVVPRREPPLYPVAQLHGRCEPRRIRGGDAYLFSEGRVIYYQCHAEYFIRGSTVQQCERSRWSEPYAPRCQPVEASQAWPSLEGEIFYESMSCPAPVRYPGLAMMFYERGLKVVYKCRSGQQFERRCSTATRQWHGGEPQCAETGGYPPSVPVQPPRPVGPAAPSPSAPSSPPSSWSGGSVCEPLEVPNGQIFQYRDAFGYIQCRKGFTLEVGGATGSQQRQRRIICDPLTGRWDIGTVAPRCVLDDTPDLRPEPPVSAGPASDDLDDTRFQIDECPLPQISSEYTWFIGDGGKKVALGCTARLARRSVGELACQAGNWRSTSREAFTCNASSSAIPAAPDSQLCTIDERDLDRNTEYFVYNGMLHVFQCAPKYKLNGKAMAACSSYTADFSSDLATINGEFVPPTCSPLDGDDVDPRPVTETDANTEPFDPHFEGNECDWPKELAALTSDDYFVSEGGRRITFRCSQTDRSRTVKCDQGRWEGDDTSCRAVQRQGCVQLPDEPRDGTFFHYQGPQGTPVIFFQCNTGFTLRGHTVVPCSNPSLSIAVPECVPDMDPFSSRLPKERNPMPTSTVRCPAPPAYITGGHVVVQHSGENVLIACRPGYVIEGASTSSAIVQCQNEAWSPYNWPRCRREAGGASPRGETTYLRSPRYDAFGRELRRELTGDKAADQMSLLRQQFLEHTRQMAEFRQRQHRSMRDQGMSYVPSTPLNLPIMPGLPDNVMQELDNTYGDVYEEARRTLGSYSDGRIRVRRKNHPSQLDPLGKVVIPAILQKIEKDIKENKLTQADVDLLVIMDDTLRAKFLEERRKGNRKSKDDPVQSQSFLSRVMAIKTNSKASTGNVIETFQQRAGEAMPVAEAFRGRLESSSSEAPTTAVGTASSTNDTTSPTAMVEAATVTVNETANVTASITDPTPLEVSTATTLSSDLLSADSPATMNDTEPSSPAVREKRQHKHEEQEEKKEEAFQQEEEGDDDDDDDDDDDFELSKDQRQNGSVSSKEINKAIETSSNEVPQSVKPASEQSSSNSTSSTVSSTTVDSVAADESSVEQPLSLSSNGTVSSNSSTAMGAAPEGYEADEPKQEPKKKLDKKQKKKNSKGYDTTCADMDNEAPQIDNGFVLSYELVSNEDQPMLRVKYRCDPDFRFEFEHTSTLLCRNGGWVGEIPRCIPDDDSDEDDW